MSQQFRSSDESGMFESSTDKSQLESRSRMVSFRVTVEELESFRRLCTRKGLRNVSEVVRLAVNQLLHEELTMPESGVSARVAKLESRLETLARSVADIESRLMARYQ